jgi:ABC-type transporter Mla MlaB component
VIVPTEEFPPRTPDTSQFTPLSLAPETVALNCSDWPTCTLALPGEMETETVAGMIETVALADAVFCTALCAVTVTGLDGTVAGAVYMPDEVTVPTVELPPDAPFTIQFTAVLLLPETAALNCWDCPTCRLALVGETETDTAGAAVIETAALAEAVDCATLCAVTLMAVEGTDSGAV